MIHRVQQMAYLDNPPWHGIGSRLERHQSLDVWAKQAGMNWKVLEAPVQFQDKVGDGTPLITFPEKKVLYRSDSKAALSVVSKRYNVVQPREILEFYRDLTEVAGFELETAGVLKGGRKCWALARTNQSAVIRGNDEVRGYLLLATACDGTLATVAKFTSVRVVCSNTLEVAIQGSGHGVKVPHSTSFDAQAVKAELGFALSSWDQFMYQMKQLSGRKMSSKEAEQFIHGVFDPDGGIEYEPTNFRAMKSVLNLFEGQGRGSELSSSKGTAFGLLNSVTEFVDHERRARNTDFRMDSAWFGPGAQLKGKALDLALGLLA